MNAGRQPVLEYQLERTVYEIVLRAVNRFLAELTPTVVEATFEE